MGLFVKKFLFSFVFFFSMSFGAVDSIDDLNVPYGRVFNEQWHQNRGGQVHELLTSKVDLEVQKYQQKDKKSVDALQNYLNEKGFLKKYFLKQNFEKTVKSVLGGIDQVRVVQDVLEGRSKYTIEELTKEELKQGYEVPHGVLFQYARNMAPYNANELLAYNLALGSCNGMVRLCYEDAVRKAGANVKLRYQILKNTMKALSDVVKNNNDEAIEQTEYLRSVMEIIGSQVRTNFEAAMLVRDVKNVVEIMESGRDLYFNFDFSYGKNPLYYRFTYKNEDGLYISTPYGLVDALDKNLKKVTVLEEICGTLFGYKEALKERVQKNMGVEYIPAH